MNIQDFTSYLDSTTLLGISMSTLFWVVVIVVVAFIFERLITRYLRRFGERKHLSVHVTYELILMFRIVIIIGALGMLVRIGGFPTEWFVAFSAIGGAAVGFASTKTIGNFVAGLYLLASRPFKVGDYVRIGNVEGVVTDLSINYTKILSIGSSTVEISNLQILERDVTNFLHKGENNEDMYCYTFEMGFDHSVQATDIARIFNECFELEAQKLPKKPRYELIRSDNVNRIYMVYLYVVNPEEIFVARPHIVEEVFKRWDEARAKTRR